MRKLNLPYPDSKIAKQNGVDFIFDKIRKKYVQLTDEEWVRQSFIHYLCNHKGYPSSLMAIEKGLRVNKLLRRTDIVVYDKEGKPKIIVECKAPSVKINQNAFDQAARYNMTLKVDFLILTNGLDHFCCKLDYTEHNYFFLKEIPDYNSLI